MTGPAKDTPPSVKAQIILALRDGLGVEDIAKRGIATIEEARRLVAVLRQNGLISEVVRRR